MLRIIVDRQSKLVRGGTLELASTDLTFGIREESARAFH
jgi:hypothetical protein